MTQTLSKMAMSLLMKLLTEAFISKMIVHGLRALADKTSNELDDAVVTDIASALGVPEG